MGAKRHKLDGQLVDRRLVGPVPADAAFHRQIADGDRWQPLEAMVSTDDGPRRSTSFFVNGEEPTRRITTAGGYTIQGTLTLSY